METTVWKITLTQQGLCDKVIYKEVNNFCDEEEDILSYLADEIKEEHGFDYAQSLRPVEGSEWHQTNWTMERFPSGCVLDGSNLLQFIPVKTGRWTVKLVGYAKNEMCTTILDESYESKDMAEMRARSIAKQKFAPSLWGDVYEAQEMGTRNDYDICVYAEEVMRLNGTGEIHRGVSLAK